MKVYGLLESAQLESLASNPSNACRGRVYYNTTSSEIRIYNGTSWVVVTTGASAARTITGSIASPTAVTAAAGITPAGSTDQLMFVRGDLAGAAAPVDITANPQIAVGSNVGDRLTLRGTSDTNYVHLEDGTGLNLNGACRLLADTVLLLEWDGSEWKETARSG